MQAAVVLWEYDVALFRLTLFEFSSHSRCFESHSKASIVGSIEGLYDARQARGQFRRKGIPWICQDVV